MIDIDDIPHSLRNNVVDFIIGTGNQQFTGIELLPLWKEKIFMAVPECHRQAYKKLATLADFEKDKFICLPQNFSYRRFTDRLLAEAGISPKTIIECFPGHIAPLIRETLSVSIIPEALILNSEPETYHGVALIPIQNTYRTIVLYYKKKSRQRPAEKKFQHYIKLIY